MTIKSIIVLLCLTFLLSSCFSTKEEIIKEDKKIVNNNEKIVEQINWLQKIPKDDIRNKTKYSENFTGIQEMFFSKNTDINILLTYLDNLEYQGIIENKEKEYANIIINIGKEYLKNIDNYKLNSFGKTILVSNLLQKIGNNYEILSEENKSIEYYKKSINKNKNNYKSYIYLGKIYERNNVDNEVVIYYNKAKEIIKNNKLIEKNKNSIKLIGEDVYYGGYINLGLIYDLLGDKVSSQKSFEKAKKIIEKGSFGNNNYEKNKALIKFKKIYNK